MKSFPKQPPSAPQFDPLLAPSPQAPAMPTPAETVLNLTAQPSPKFDPFKHDEAIAKACALMEIQKAIILTNSEHKQGAGPLTNPLPLLGEKSANGLHLLILESMAELRRESEGMYQRAGGAL